MPTPTEPFSHLSLQSPSLSHTGAHLGSPTPFQLESYPGVSESDMPASAVVRARAIRLQDILSSFEENTLPSELQPGIFDNILQNVNHSYITRSRTKDYTIPGNKDGTFLQWGAYDEEKYNALIDIQSPEGCEVNFRQTLGTRFKKCIDEYDYDVVQKRPLSDEVKSEIGDAVKNLRALQNLCDDAATIQEAIDKIKALSNFDPRSTLHLIATELKTLSHALTKDRKGRDLTEVKVEFEIGTLALVLATLKDICRRSKTTATAAGPIPSLFAVLITPEASTSQFLLDGLEYFSAESLHARLEDLVEINGMLHRNEAPKHYIARFEALQDRANDVSPTSPMKPGGRKRGREADRESSSKRPYYSPGKGSRTTKTA